MVRGLVAGGILGSRAFSGGHWKGCEVQGEVGLVRGEGLWWRGVLAVAAAAAAGWGE